MNMALDRLLEGIIATLRNDVIPHVSDSYARGQAVGVIDLLNNIGARLEWARAPLLAEIEEKRALLKALAEKLPVIEAPSSESLDASADLRAERDRLDARIGDALAVAARDEGAAGVQALALIRQHLHDSATREMKLTRKPLFAEIASGPDKTAP